MYVLVCMCGMHADPIYIKYIAPCIHASKVASPQRPEADNDISQEGYSTRDG